MHKPQAYGALAEGRASPGMCITLHRQPTANEQPRDIRIASISLKTMLLEARKAHVSLMIASRTQKRMKMEAGKTKFLLP